MNSLGIRPTLVTRPESRIASSLDAELLRPYSLGWRDFSTESRGKRLSLGLAICYAVSATLGRVFDWAFEKLAGSYSYGKWSWIFLAFPTALLATIRLKNRVIFCTGGPSSAHFVGLLVKLILPKSQLYIELQDPFIGTEMALNSRSRKVLDVLEGFLVRNATKVVFVTDAAAERARARYPDERVKRRIVSIYPGSWRFQIDSHSQEKSTTKEIRFLHVGSLYSSRNLDLFFEALDILRDAGSRSALRVQVINQGDLNVENQSTYLNRADFKSFPLVGREVALEMAASADFLLLVQHSDSRSEETIPYKTYDYMNLGVPIFGLTKNQELDDLISKSGGYSGSSTDLEKTITSLKIALSSFEANESLSNQDKTEGFAIDIKMQFAKLFE
jgi:glycosyltransferase involved in cell wall biosynthesis